MQGITENSIITFSPHPPIDLKFACPITILRFYMGLHRCTVC